MQSFPPEFTEFLSPRARALAGNGAADLHASFRDGTPFAFTGAILTRPTVDRAIALLDEHLYRHVRPMRTPIPATTITGMTANYSEQLPKTVSVKTASLNASRSAAARAARAVGLDAMLRSASMHRFAEAVSGCRLDAQAGCQVICYETGDYTGPHNDHHPEDAHLRDGYVDVQIMLSNDAVASQLLVYERGGFLSEAVDIAVPSGVAVYRLPFWHYTTPLLAKPGRAAEARRWLLLASFMFAG